MALRNLSRCLAVPARTTSRSLACSNAAAQKASFDVDLQKEIHALVRQIVEHDVKGFARRKEERQSKINININVGRQPNKQTNNASTDGNIPYARIEGPDCASIHREIEVRIRQHHAGELETATTVYNMYEEKEETAGQHKVVGQGKEEEKEETAGQDTVVGEEKGNATKATQSKDGTGPEGAREQKAGDKETGREVWPIAQPRTLASNHTPTHRYLTESRTPHRHPIESAGPSIDAAFTGLGCFLGIGSDLVMMVGSFGATSTLVFGAPAAPFSQPRCVIGGHMLSASIGIATAIVIPDFFTVAGTEYLGVALAAPIAVSAAAVAMQLTKTMHPPAGGTALIAVLGSETINGLGFSFLCPVGVSALTLLALGVVVNNVHPGRRHAPKNGRWW